MATTVATTTTTAAGRRATSPPPPPTHPADENLTSSAALLAELLRGAGPTSHSHSPAAAAAATSTNRCPLFPTESEDYYCLSCYARCSGLSLLVGPHTNHDYLPFQDALLYMPAALLRETQEVVRESEESFAKPWRAQDQQREETLAYLLHLRQSKVAAVARLMEEIQQVDQQLLHVTEAKAVNLSNWRYQQRALRRKMEKLKSGADTLWASLTADVQAPSSRPTRVAAAATAAPSWQHSQQVAQKELAQVQGLLQQQLRQLEIDEAAALDQLQTWHGLLNAVPQGCNGETEKLPPHHSPVRAHSTQPTSPAPPSPSSSAVPGALVCSAVEPPALHPSNAEVVLLQHALRSVNDGLRHRLLRAAAASLASSSASSSSSRLPSSSREGTSCSYFPYTPVLAAEMISSGLSPLPGETPLREQVAVAALSHPPLTPEATKPAATGEGKRPAAALKSPPRRPRSPTSGSAPSGVDLQAEEEEKDGHAQQARWQSWQAQEQALKASLNQLLQSAAASVENSARTPPSSSLSGSSNEKSRGAAYGAAMLR
ncbi:hypothetical protein ABB37_07943 [Leptomonas pyrrhocoris]|uniref:Uncharacterized protein n=1 Tax=Leptomonas pyrrhocoris TaxID=157538 RepID=A0A0N0DSN2_LEPPY|nr:hypothetical protein ABB37_07943 [Leptomonas pyrrhocoris]KPA76184.1 hypothetical protein ABB37_07943 [Leptomonas pyrrhocoris]|eukprot:XP_015654623.1 hypothetical protein ABB37_07943 [Leptomonas pyrrhocoris]